MSLNQVTFFYVSPGHFFCVLPGHIGVGCLSWSGPPLHWCPAQRLWSGQRTRTTQSSPDLSRQSAGSPGLMDGWMDGWIDGLGECLTCTEYILM